MMCYFLSPSFSLSFSPPILSSFIKDTVDKRPYLSLPVS